MYELLKDQYEIYGAGVKPVKAPGVTWIDDQIRAMEKLVDKYGLYTSHLQDVILILPSREIAYYCKENLKN